MITSYLRKARIIGFCCLLIFPTIPISAQVVTAPRVEDKRIYRNAVQSTIALIKDKMSPALIGEEKAAFSSISFVIEDDNMNYWDFRSEPKTNSIYIPLGFVVMADQIEFAMQINEKLQLPPEPLYRFIKQFISVLRYNTENQRRRPKAFPVYQQFANVSGLQMETLRTNEEFQVAHIYGKVAGLTAVLMHEFAHLRGISNEDKADNFAIDRMLRSDVSLLGAAWSFMIYAYIEESIETDPGTHLPAGCRVSNLIRQGVVFHSKDEGFASFMKSRDPEEKWRKVPDQIEELLTQDGVRCDPERHPGAPAAAPAEGWPTGG